MTKLEQIERSIMELSPEELQSFTEWFERMQEVNFDAAIARDAREGRLDGLAEAALAAFKTGRTRPL